MPLLPGARVGSYEIVAPVGAGGMGEVYRARDNRLGRDAALKLLPDDLANDPERRGRFEREARTLAGLNHPSIVTIFGVEEVGGENVIAMEWVDGPTLADIIPKGGLSLERLLRIATQVTDAVAAAHRHGIVHRDLKPANMMLTARDRVKVLDFGLAKERLAGDGQAETLLPTRAITTEGRIVGTVAYMSPEQAEGRNVDERSDIFSLGVVLYEMAVGERPFKGDSGLSILSSILRDAPKPLGDINPALPPEFVRIVRRCLAKDPEDRWQSATDLRYNLEDLRQAMHAGELASRAAAPPARRWLAPIAVGGLVLAAVAAVAWAVWRGSSGPATAPRLTFSRLTLLEGVAQEPMISPDGKWVVYVSNMSGNADIYLQSTAGQTTINLTQDSTAADDMPAFSPDGDLIAFHSAREGGGLFLMGRTGESVRRLTRFGFQPAWFPDGRRIVFASTNVPFADTRGGTISELWTVDTVGGEPRRLFAGDAVQPKVSPSGQRIAFWSMPTRSDGGGFAEANRDVWTMAVDGSDAVRVTTDLATDWNPVWSPDGHWLYFLSNRAGSMNLWRVPIDQATGVTSGEPEALSAPAPYIRHFSVSADGGLGTYATWSTTNNVARAPFDPVAGAPSGPVQSLTTGPRDFQFLGVSPDGQQLVVGNNSRLQQDLFVLPAAGGVLRNLTNDPALDRNPQWSHDGRQIVFNSDRGSDYEVWSVDRDGGGLRAVTQSNGRRFYPVPSRDGSSIVAADITTWQAFIYDARNPSKPPIELPPFPTELRTGGYTFAISDWSPNGREVIGHTGGANSRLWVFSLDSQNYRVVAGDPPLSAARWLSDGRRVLAQRNGILLLIDTVSGHARDVLAIPGENLSAPAPTVDGRFLYFLRGTASGDIWLVRFDPRGSGG